MATAVSAHDTRSKFGHESTYGSTAGTIDAPFGKNLRFTVSANNNVQEIPDISTRNPVELKPGKFVGELNVNGSLASPYWLEGVLGSEATTGSGPYTHTYTEANNPPSITAILSHDTDTDIDREFLGWKIDECRISGSIGNPIEFSLSGRFQKEALGTTLDTHVSDTESAFIYHNATLQFGGATIGFVQDFEFIITNGNQDVDDISSRLVQDQRGGPRRYRVRANVRLNDATDLLQDFLGQSSGTLDGDLSETSSAVITITNGESGTDERSITLTLANLMINTHSENVTPGELVGEEAEIFARSLTDIVYINNTATALGG